MTRPTRLILVLVTLGIAACGSDDPMPSYPPPPDSGPAVKWDGGGFSWTDIGGWYGQQDGGGFYDQPDQGPAPADLGPPVTDGGNDGAPDNSNCKSPAGASCPQACASSEVCSGAKGGMCTKVVELSGPASGKEVLKAVALAYVDCWHKQPSSDTLCVAFDACKMTGTVTASMVEDWVCNTAQVADFPSSAKHGEAQDLCGCSWYGYDRADWQINSASSGEQGTVCLTYDVNAWLYYDHLNVDYCKQFPPQ